jgi:hypothetical protein
MFGILTQDSSESNKNLKLPTNQASPQQHSIKKRKHHLAVGKISVNDLLSLLVSLHARVSQFSFLFLLVHHCHCRLNTAAAKKKCQM